MRDNRIVVRIALLISLVITLTLVSTRLRADTATCGGAAVTLPFTDVANSGVFCQIAEAFFSNLVDGVSSTRFRPSTKVDRGELADAVSRTQDSAIRRGSKRAALNQWWTTTPHYDINLGVTQIQGPRLVQSDGTDLWVSHDFHGTVSRVRASDGKLLQTWSGATNASNILVAMGRIFVAGLGSSGALYMIDPAQPEGDVTTVAVTGGNGTQALVFDGTRIWLVNSSNTISIVSPGPTLPWTFQVVTGFGNLAGALYDGKNVWVTSFLSGNLTRLDSTGHPLQTITLGPGLQQPVFDGMNIWVPNARSNSVSVVRASSGEVLATLTGNGLNAPYQAAFDGERILVTNPLGDSVSLWKAGDLSPIGVFPAGLHSSPFGVCSDGVSFWVTIFSPDGLARF